MRIKALLVVGVWGFSGLASAQSTVSTPYLDQLRKELDQGDQAKGGSYIDQIKKQIGPSGTEGQSYIEELRQKDPSLNPPATAKSPEQKTPPSYTAQEKSKIGPGSSASPILSYRKHEPPRLYQAHGASRHGFSLRMSTGGTRNYSADPAIASGRDFTDIYAQNWVPDLTLTYDYKFLSDELLGNVGIQISQGASVQKGFGLFSKALNKGWTSGETFSEESDVRFNFLTFPLTVGLRAQFDLLRVIRPYFNAGLAAIGFAETRNDDKPDKRAISTGSIMGGGVLIPLTWLSQKSAWNLYDDFRIKAYYLNVDYTRISTLSGKVDLTSDQLSAGFTFEF